MISESQVACSDDQAVLSQDGLIDPIVLSHRRSLEFGLRESDIPDFSPIMRSDLSYLIEKNHTLYTHALPVMEALREQILNTHNMVLLTDPKGLVLHTLGDDDFLEKADKVALRAGVTWSEQSKGTNAIGTAIVHGEPTTVHANQHYLRVNHFLTCSCAPIYDPHGSIVGALDVSGDHHSYHKHTMALVRMSAQMVENQLFAATFPEAIRIHFHSRSEFIGTLMEGIAVFNSAGRFLAANRSGQFQLGLPLRGLQAHSFSSLFGMGVSALFDLSRNSATRTLCTSLYNGVTVHIRTEFSGLFPNFGGSARGSERAALHPTTIEARAQTPAANGSASQKTTVRQGLSSLRHLNTGDPLVAGVIEKVQKVINRDISILVLGETGTGKELLAQAIHNDSPRHDGPFVAINCASIPETLIESELFGYAEGAFTGARKKGGQGKLLQANGGTLFLDEIGDMPVNLQARLLRVLQERVVNPLGSDKLIPTDVNVICATNRNLREMIQKGEFREDLYYRLNGLVVKLPPLRQRTDLDIVIRKVLDAEPESRGRLSIANDVMEMFRRFSWPGNFRQLATLLRTACIMAQDDGEIRVEHLPDDFLEDWSLLGDNPCLNAPMVTLRRDADSIGAVPPVAERTPVFNATLEDVEAQTISDTLDKFNGNVSAAARALGVSRNTIYRKMENLRKTKPG